MSQLLQLGSSGILSLSTKPLQLGIFVGSVFAIFSLLIIIWTLIEFLVDQSIPSGWTSLVILLLMFSGIQLIVLGVIGFYVGGIYEEVKDRPRYIIDEVISHDE